MPDKTSAGGADDVATQAEAQTQPGPDDTPPGSPPPDGAAALRPGEGEQPPADAIASQQPDAEDPQGEDAEDLSWPNREFSEWPDFPHGVAKGMLLAAVEDVERDTGVEVGTTEGLSALYAFGRRKGWDLPLETYYRELRSLTGDVMPPWGEHDQGVLLALAQFVGAAGRLAPLADEQLIANDAEAKEAAGLARLQQMRRRVSSRRQKTAERRARRPAAIARLLAQRRANEQARAEARDGAAAPAPAARPAGKPGKPGPGGKGGKGGRK